MGAPIVFLACLIGGYHFVNYSLWCRVFSVHRHRSEEISKLKLSFDQFRFNTCFSFRVKCLLRGGVGGQFVRNLNNTDL